jgi:hypothetical protein
VRLAAGLSVSGLCVLCVLCGSFLLLLLLLLLKQTTTENTESTEQSREEKSREGPKEVRQQDERQLRCTAGHAARHALLTAPDTSP